METIPVRFLSGKRRGVVYTGILLGLDYSGKTSLLYRLKLDCEVQTIPTIGFNLEEIKGTEETVFELWDIGGCDKIRNVVHHYIKENSFILFLYDCTDVERIDEAAAYLDLNMQSMRRAGSRHVWVLLNKQDALPESDRGRLVSHARQRFEQVTALYTDIHATIVDSPGLSGKTGMQLEEMMASIHQTLSSSKVGAHSKTRPAPSKPEIQASVSQGELLDRAHQANSAADDAATFWEMFKTGHLKTWDHYNHLRAGYLVLIDRFGSGRAIADCAECFIEHLERLRNHDPQRFRNTTHRTMTFFWMVQLLWCTKVYQAAKGLPNFPEREDFGHVLVNSPSLMDTHLWQQFYTRELMFSPEAKKSWFPPTLKPLPAIIPQNRSLEKITPTEKLQDASEHLLKFGFATAGAALQTGARRGAVVKEALQTLQKSTFERRTLNSNIPPYSETQAYFWVQIAHAALCGVPDLAEKDLSAMTMSQLKSKFGISGDEWRRYYSVELWKSISARMRFMPPDLLPLPNILSRTAT